MRGVVSAGATVADSLASCVCVLLCVDHHLFLCWCGGCFQESDGCVCVCVCKHEGWMGARGTWFLAADGTQHRLMCCEPTCSQQHWRWPCPATAVHAMHLGDMACGWMRGFWFGCLWPLAIECDTQQHRQLQDGCYLACIALHTMRCRPCTAAMFCRAWMVVTCVLYFHCLHCSGWQAVV